MGFLLGCYQCCASELGKSVSLTLFARWIMMALALWAQVIGPLLDRRSVVRSFNSNRGHESARTRVFGIRLVEMHIAR